MARRRHRMSRKGSRKSFARNSGIHKRNLTRGVPRGGIRL